MRRFHLETNWDLDSTTFILLKTSQIFHINFMSTKLNENHLWSIAYYFAL